MSCAIQELTTGVFPQDRCLSGSRVSTSSTPGQEPGGGACMGEVHAAILKALCCDGTITNGGVRDLPTVKKLKFSRLAPFVTISHLYMHQADYGEPAEIFGLK